jgi:hypothetical protein
VNVRLLRIERTVLTLVATALSTLGTVAQSTPHYLIVNNNHPVGNFATFFKLATDGTFISQQKVVTGGKGVALPQLFETPSSQGVVTFHSASQDCVFVSDAGTSDIAAIDSTLKVVGRFRGGASDLNNFAGIALAINQNFLYAAFTGAANSSLGGALGSFAIESGCRLKFLGSVPAVGTGFGHPILRYPVAIAAHAKILVLVYGDGSIESFHFSNGLAESNGDLQNSTATENQEGVTSSVDITQDAKFAVFGINVGEGATGAVEVANISSGKLSTSSTVYTLADYFSSYVHLSPDESLLYQSGPGGAGAAFFNKTTGAVTDGCFGALKDPDEGRTTEWWFVFGQALANNASGTGGTVYYAENTVVPGSAGNDQYVGFVNASSSGNSCTLTESPKSNVEMESNSSDFGTLATWPPRGF